MPNLSNFKGNCFCRSLGRSLRQKLRPKCDSVDLYLLAYVIFTDEENSYTCTVDFASITLLNGTRNNVPCHASAMSSSFVRWHLLSVNFDMHMDNWNSPLRFQVEVIIFKAFTTVYRAGLHSAGNFRRRFEDYVTHYLTSVGHPFFLKRPWHDTPTNMKLPFYCLPADISKLNPQNWHPRLKISKFHVTARYYPSNNA